ncbi:hypothetical protein AAFP30_07695 [Gordonia sp. CPCC 205515]|uniref:hypothetical protein n=1 Tax=Gordonia sp. CPCC 205515 TaxID=3140791 RepID=UPI003AF3EA20
MRKLTVSAAAVAVVVAGAGITAMVAGGSPTTAAPLPTPCGSFAGSGPSPTCAYRVGDRTLQVSLRNTARGPSPVTCALTWPLSDRPLSSTNMGPGERGSLSAAVPAGVQRYTVDCRSVVPVADAVQRRVTFTVTGSGFAPPPPRTSRPQWTPPKSPPPRWTPPSTTRAPLPQQPQLRLPTVTPPTVTPTTQRFGPPNRMRPPRPTMPKTTTTTTTPVR